MPTSKVTLQSLFPDFWDEQRPSTLVELVNADYEVLDQHGRDLRALAMQLVFAFERKPVLTARNAMELLEAHHLTAPQGRWNIVVLGPDRERMYERAKGTTLRLVHHVSSAIPDPSVLAKKAPLPEGGTYLLIRGGGPDALAEPTTLDAYLRLKNALPIADVVLWDDGEEVATFWSIGAGVGQRGNAVIDFPDPGVLDHWRTT
jgi:hypothetical protein